MDKDASDIPSAAEVMDDYEGEQESLDLQINTGDDDTDSEDDDDGGGGDEDADNEANLAFLGLEDVIKKASKGVTEGTDSEYRRYEHTICPSFCF